ncbi:LysR family transcriptional regulator [Brevibacillus sp. B_LB10_24]|uniref:LysR family transcriptional regulator n=1 Tax=Brevibacillus sp. B_LB10_24 TaxID=3380645 RepID=UPI0038B7482C
MELRQLEYFVAVCEQLHFSRAAERLNTTQSNLSQQIKLLENELGIPLFDRMGKRIALTEAGRLVYEQSQRIFSHLQYTRDAIEEMKHVQGGTLSIGVLPGDADLLFNALLVEFHRTYPKISLSVIETTKISEQIIQGTIDIGVTTTPPPDKRLTIIPLVNEEFALAVRSDNPLARKKAVPFSSLQNLKMVMFPPDHQVRQLIDQTCLQSGFRLQPHIETTTLSSLLSLVEQGIGACVLPRLLLDSLGSKEIVTVPLTDPVPSQDICIVYRSDRYIGFAARTFMDILQAYIQAAIERSGSKHAVAK